MVYKYRKGKKRQATKGYISIEKENNVKQQKGILVQKKNITSSNKRAY